jgi:uncharacterized protein
MSGTSRLEMSGGKRLGSIGTFLSETGTAARHNGTLHVGSTASGAELALPYIVLRGAKPGRTLWINGQVHGDELNGVVAALQFVNSLDPAQMDGNVVVTPTGNPQAMDQRRKRNAIDDLDLDQSYPGNANGLTTERVARALFSEIKGVADVVISLHTMNPLFDARPYSVYKLHPGSGIAENELLAAMAHFHPRVACRQKVSGEGELPGNISGGLDYQCLAAGILAFMLELGTGSRLQDDNVALARNGFRSLALQMGIVHGRADAPATELRRVTSRGWITADEGGLFVSRTRAGELVKAGESIGDLMRLDGTTTAAPPFEQPGVLIGLRSDPVVHTGERLAFVAWQWDQVTCTAE